jgi:hypothetical protein
MPSLSLMKRQHLTDVRRSYRLVGQTNPPFEPGQTDTFFLNRPPYVVVLELFAADTYGDIVPDYQEVLIHCE